MEQTLKELSAELAVIHESLERAEAVERQLGVYWREFEAERDQLRAQVETASGNARLYADRCASLEAELAEARKDGERLDEAARGQYSIRYNAMNEQWEVTTGALHPAHRRYAYRKTIRAAIDAARGAK